jgi:hypothetical protein
MAVIVYENALTYINCSDLFQSETVPYDWEEHEFEHDGTSLDTHGHSGDNGKSATKLKQRGLAIYNYLRGMGSLSGRWSQRRD